MAITSARMQMKRGEEAYFDPDKMLPGEWALSTDTRIVRICVAPGIVKEIASTEEVKDAILKGLISIQEAEENALINISEGVDNTLSVSGKAADAKVTGEKLGQLSNEINTLIKIPSLSVQGFLLISDGTITPQGVENYENGKTTDFIDISNYTFMEYMTHLNWQYISVAFYDKDKQLIPELSIINNSGDMLISGSIDLTFSDYSEVRYIRLCAYDNKRVWGEDVFVCKLYSQTITKVKTLEQQVDYLYNVDSEPYEITKTVSVNPDTHFDCAIPYNFKKNETVKIIVNADDTTVDSEAIGLSIGVMYKTGEILNATGHFKTNTEIEYTFTEDASQIRFWLDKSYILQNGTVSVIVSNQFLKNIHNKIDEFEKIIQSFTILNKTMSILGDSYSTYENWIPDSYTSWYADSGNAQENNVNSVHDTWWYQLSKETNTLLLSNSSYGGSTICNTGYDGKDTSLYSFITRMKKDLGEERILQAKPDIIFVFGGTNDSWASVPIGELMYSDWVDNDLKSFLPAFCYMLDYLKTWNPQARIINIVNTGLSSQITNGMATACNHYNVENLVLSNIEKENGHPNKAGMISIKNQVLELL